MKFIDLKRTFKRIWYTTKYIIYFLTWIGLFFFALTSHIGFIILAVLFGLAIVSLLLFVLYHYIRERWNGYGSL